MNRIWEHLSQVGFNILEGQFRFRAEKSAIEAIDRVVSLARSAVSPGGGGVEGRMALAMSLDIVNAFNSLPWTRIHQALRRHEVPMYIRNIIKDYLNNRTVI